MHDLTLTETVQSSSTPSNVVSTPTKRWLATALTKNLVMMSLYVKLTVYSLVE